MPNHIDTHSSASCSFCGKSQSQVRRAHQRPRSHLDLRQVYCPVAAHHCHREPAARAGSASQPPQEPESKNTLAEARRVRHRPGARQEGAVRGGLQPLQAHLVGDGIGRGRGAGEDQHTACRPHGLRQDPAGPNPGACSGRPVLHRGRHLRHGGRLRGRGRGEHPASPHTGR